MDCLLLQSFNYLILKQIISRPRWALGMFKSQKDIFFGNVIGHAEGVTDSGALWSWIAEQFDASFFMGMI